MNKKIAGIVWRLVIYGGILLFVVSFVPFLVYISPKRTVTETSPAAYRLEYEDVILHTKDNMTLAAWFIPNKASDQALIVCHGYPMDKGDIFMVTTFLAKQYNLLYFDFRAMGKSAGRISTSGWKEREDVLAAAAFLKTKGFQHIGAFGFSAGAAAVLMANSPDITCIVSDSSYAALNDILRIMFRISGPFQDMVTAMAKIYARIFLRMNTDDVAPVKYISGMRIPILLIHCAQDTVIPAEEAKKLHEANPRTRLWLIPAGDHGESSYANAYEDTVIGFFNTCFGK
ncbi:MAG: alpha/beta hydrolase [Candidatus Omnitrophota bacterium]